MALTPSRTSFTERDTETAELFADLAAARTDEERERLIEQIAGLYLGLCTAMASRYTGRGVEFEDLVQVARLALVKSIHRYEPGHGPSFASYAVPTISGELKRWFRDRGWVVRPPRRLQELRASVQKARATLEQEFGAEPSDTDLADYLGLTVDQVREAATASTGFRALSLDCQPTDDHRPGLELFLARPDEDLDAADDRVCLTEALTTLDEDERELLAMRFVEGMTQREIGELRGVSQMQVSRTLRRIIGRLRQGLLDENEDSAVAG
jgi:RNA polymerase sigma-B factor